MAKKKSTRKPRTKAAKNRGERAPTLVYIHGIGEQEPPAELKLAWDHALFGRSLGERSRMAYWADIRHGPETLRTRTRSIERPELDDSEEGVDVAELVREAGIPTRKRAAAEAWGASLSETLQERAAQRPRTRGVHAKVLPLPAWLRKRITERITRLLIRDTAAYLFDPEQKRAMQARLRDVLAGIEGPLVLVSHSQGTIISYDVLSALGREVDVVRWLTLGSPLGVQEVQDHITKPLRAPGGVKAWENFADLFDPVALDKGLRSDFAPKDFVHDVTVVNRSTLKLWGFNPHAALGYLATSDVRRSVSTALGSGIDLLARFVVASDVSRAMADPISRHPVLIEIKDPERGEASDGGLGERRERLAAELVAMAARTDEVEEARIDPLRRFVSARLTSNEIRELERRHDSLHVYAIWKNAKKRKLLVRSSNVIQAIPAHGTYAATGKGITWAVLDTGVAGNHPHFAAKKTIRSVWDCTKVGSPKHIEGAKARDRDGHGTHVSGIVAGERAGGDTRLAGIAPDARLAVYKVLDDDGGGEDGWIIKALDHIARQNESSSSLVVHGVNLSLGGWFDPEVYGCGHSPICAELRRLWRQGVVVCVACGNEGQITVETGDGEFDLNTSLSIGDPANLEECIAVGSVNADKPHLYGISWFSSRGPTADGRAKPDVVAPGERILSANGSFVKAKPASHYVEQSGTSMACPHVSGLLAAFLSVRREFIGHPDELKRILMDNCTDIGRDRYHQGRGIPNLMRMLANT